MNIYALTLEILLACLLVIAIAYCWRLDSKLKALRNGNARMLEAARELQQSVIHAENAVGALRRSAEAAGRELQSKIDESRALAAAPHRDAPRDTVDFSLRRRSVL
jgi:uncharacterized protein YlxW (UPF0749 family)